MRLCRPVFIVSACSCLCDVCVSQNTLVRALVPICLYCLNCSKFDPLILMKIIKIVATRCQILRLKCTKFDFGAGGAYSAPPDPLAGFVGRFAAGGGWAGEQEGKGERGGRGKWRGGKRRVPKLLLNQGPLRTLLRHCKFLLRKHVSSLYKIER